MNVMNGIQLNIDAYTYYDYLKYAILERTEVDHIIQIIHVIMEGYWILMI
jgi:hypothetical protein